MIKKLAIIVITTLALTLNVSAGTDGELSLKKNERLVKTTGSKLNRCFNFFVVDFSASYYYWEVVT